MAERDLAAAVAPRLHRGSPERPRLQVEAARLYRAGRRAKEITATLGISAQTLSKWLRAAGVRWRERACRPKRPSAATIERKCRGCGRRFLVFRCQAHEWHCTKRCAPPPPMHPKALRRMLDARERRTRACLFCKRVFLAKKQAAAKEAKTCSKACWVAYFRPRVPIAAAPREEKTCPTCGKVFVVRASRRRKTCSWACKPKPSAAQVAAMRAAKETAPRWLARRAASAAKRTGPCSICGKVFTRPLRSNDVKTCGPACSTAQRSASMRERHRERAALRAEVGARWAEAIERARAARKAAETPVVAE